MDVTSIYRSKLATPSEAVDHIPSGVNLSMGMATTEPPALLKALADPDKTVFTFAMGQKAMYEFLHDNPSVESHPVDYVNQPHVIAQNPRIEIFRQ